MIGALRHRLVIEAANPGDDGLGGETDPWLTPTIVATVWGQVQPLAGRERVQAMQISSRVTHRVTLRHRDDVLAGHRIRFGQRTLNIRSVIDVGERGRSLDLLCEEGGAT